MTKHIVNSDVKLEQFVATVTENYRQHRYLRIDVKTGKDRTLDQNALIHAWFQEIAKALPEDDVLGWKNFCKLHFGCPILAADDHEFESFCDAALRPLSYEDRLKAISYVDVSSIMTVKQLNRYADMIAEHFRTHFGLELSKSE